MFDIGFSELAMIAVVALLVIGPRELPTLLRGINSWVKRARGIASEFKNELSREVAQAEELKRLVERETDIAKLHKLLDEARLPATLDPRQDGAGNEPGAGSTSGQGHSTDTQPGPETHPAQSGRDRDGRTQ